MEKIRTVDLMVLEKISLNRNVEYGAMKISRIFCSMGLEKIPWKNPWLGVRWSSKVLIIFQKFILKSTIKTPIFHGKIQNSESDGPWKDISLWERWTVKKIIICSMALENILQKTHVYKCDGPRKNYLKIHKLSSIGPQKKKVDH